MRDYFTFSTTFGTETEVVECLMIFIGNFGEVIDFFLIQGLGGSRVGLVGWGSL